MKKTQVLAQNKTAKEEETGSQTDSHSNRTKYAVICFDDSDYMRNGDIRPNRLAAEQDAVNMIGHQILTESPLNRAGIVTLTDNRVIQPLTRNEINFMRQLYTIKIDGTKGPVNLISSLKTALLVIKNAPQDNQIGRRIIAFVGSPVTVEAKELDVIAKSMEKNNVSVDIVCFGSENESKIQMLESFVAKLKGSSLVNVPNDKVLSTFVANSSVVSKGQSVPVNDHNIDPELAMVLKASNERDIQFEADLKRALEESTQQSNQKESTVAAEDEDLQRAIDLSLKFMEKNNISVAKDSSQTNSAKSQPKSQPQSEQKSQPKSQTKSQLNGKPLTESEQLALAMQMSVSQSQKTQQKNDNSKKEDNSGKQSGQVKSKSGRPSGKSNEDNANKKNDKSN